MTNDCILKDGLRHACQLVAERQGLDKHFLDIIIDSEAQRNHSVNRNLITKVQKYLDTSFLYHPELKATARHILGINYSSVWVEVEFDYHNETNQKIFTVKSEFPLILLKLI